MMIFRNCVKSNPIITRTAQTKVARIDIGIKAPKLVAILAGTPFGIRIVRFLSWANFMNSAAITLTIIIENIPLTERPVQSRVFPDKSMGDTTIREHATVTILPMF